MQHFSRWLIVLIALLGLGGIAYLWWQKQQVPAPVPITAVPLPAQTPVVEAPAPAASEPANYPIEAVAALNAARIAGKTDEEIRALVVKLEAARKSAA